MSPVIRHSRRRLVEYDAIKRRLWIGGQRCHHGATGALVAGLACVGLVAERHVAGPMIALAVTGGALMAHDWKDHAIWFERGYGTQP
jgi:hypothetical protein